jgi:hypothetical protein
LSCLSTVSTLSKVRTPLAALIHLVQHPADLGPVTEAIDLLTDTLLSHFAYEERELAGPLARHGFYPGQL